MPLTQERVEWRACLDDTELSETEEEDMNRADKRGERAVREVDKELDETAKIIGKELQKTKEEQAAIWGSPDRR